MSHDPDSIALTLQQAATRGFIFGGLATSVFGCIVLAILAISYTACGG